MQEFTIRVESIPDLTQRAGQTFHAVRAKILEEAGETAKKLVDNQIIASGVNDANGHIRSWQQIHKGSGGGYVAVRPRKSQAGETLGSTPGAVTNYLNSGHKTRQPSGHAKRYKPEIRTFRARAFRFYNTAWEQLVREEQEYAERMERAMQQALEAIR